MNESFMRLHNVIIGGMQDMSAVAMGDMYTQQHDLTWQRVFRYAYGVETGTFI